MASHRGGTLKTDHAGRSPRDVDGQTGRGKESKRGSLGNRAGSTLRGEDWLVGYLFDVWELGFYLSIFCIKQPHPRSALMTFSHHRTRGERRPRHDILPLGEYPQRHFHMNLIPRRRMMYEVGAMKMLQGTMLRPCIRIGAPPSIPKICNPPNLIQIQKPIEGHNKHRRTRLLMTTFVLPNAGSRNALGDRRMPLEHCLWGSRGDKLGMRRKRGVVSTFGQPPKNTSSSLSLISLISLHLAFREPRGTPTYIVNTNARMKVFLLHLALTRKRTNRCVYMHLTSRYLLIPTHHSVKGGVLIQRHSCTQHPRPRHLHITCKGGSHILFQHQSELLRPCLRELWGLNFSFVAKGDRRRQLGTLRNLRELRGEWSSIVDINDHVRPRPLQRRYPRRNLPGSTARKDIFENSEEAVGRFLSSSFNIHDVHLNGVFLSSSPVSESSSAQSEELLMLLYNAPISATVLPLRTVTISKKTQYRDQLLYRTTSGAALPSWIRLRHAEVGKGDAGFFSKTSMFSGLIRRRGVESISSEPLIAVKKVAKLQSAQRFQQEVVRLILLLHLQSRLGERVSRCTWALEMNSGNIRAVVMMRGAGLTYRFNRMLLAKAFQSLTPPRSLCSRLSPIRNSPLPATSFYRRNPIVSLRVFASGMKRPLIPRPLEFTISLSVQMAQGLKTTKQLSNPFH
ncbi:uncharacterized protein BDR25DRAFT_392108 [Lindgomyces ingoldianus]|uniref:Uncharacterized protein n=1 Tax=Lindgomyces ingoldianus TaxID=673940 RepID=A0ACB6R810_9PLEO|nr:uncharacterized protein BDR25DRAFT_392108 [Lindgomyces ingoldianus]KAF2474457.1 hypothetical protein BDR25DRAFT_392108 [Lindgomyces ingoldianus]